MTMNKRKVIILGFDGMDYDYMQSIIEELPNIKMLADNKTVKPFKSVFPPDSIPSWITCYTGLDPSEHGILESVDYLSKKKDSCVKGDNSVVRGNTFWDVISHLGHEVCVVNPFMAYPVWPVNGVMVNGPVFIDGNIQISDMSKVSGLTVPTSLGGMTDFPTKKEMGTFVNKIFTDTNEQAEFGISLISKNNPDLFYQTFLTMDRIQHFLWRYCDKNDPTYIADTPHKTAIKDFYIESDRIIGQYLGICGDDDILIVISDHGHGMRCTKCFNINEFLRRRGDLISSADGKLISHRLMLELSKNFVLNFMHENNLEDYISKIAKLIPGAKKLKKGKHITKESTNRAYASDFTGTNPFGGICINKKLIGNYNKFRDQLMTDLLAVEDDGVKVVEWVKRRENMFSGKYTESYPDILFGLNPIYGVNWNLHTSLFTVNPTHKKVSGGHKEVGVFLSNSVINHPDNSSEIRMDNFFDTILNLFSNFTSKDNVTKNG